MFVFMTLRLWCVSLCVSVACGVFCVVFVRICPCSCTCVCGRKERVSSGGWGLCLYCLFVWSRICLRMRTKCFCRLCSVCARICFGCGVTGRACVCGVVCSECGVRRFVLSFPRRKWRCRPTLPVTVHHVYHGLGECCGRSKP